MDNHHQPCLPRFVLKMKKTKSCKICFKRLKKWIEKISGVNSVAVKPEKKLVYVSGKIQPQKLIKKIHSELDKEATLCQQKSTSKDNDQQNEQDVDNNVKNKDRCTDNSNSTDSDDDDDGESSTHCCSDNKPHYNRSGRGRRHKAEPYVEPPRNMVDEEICGDNLCLLHPRNSIFRNGQPYFMQPPFFGRGPMPPYPMRMPPPPPPPPYSMGMPPPGPPPPHPAYGYGYSRRHLPAGFDHVSDFFNDENARGCSIM